MLRTLIIVFLVAASAGTAVAGSAPTWRQATNQACAARNASEARLEPGDSGDRDQLLRFFRGVAVAQRTLVARHESLRPPRVVRPEFRRLVSAEREVTPLLEEAVRLLVKGVAPSRVLARVVSRVVGVNARIDVEARSLRVPSCIAP